MSFTLITVDVYFVLGKGLMTYLFLLQSLILIDKSIRLFAVKALHLSHHIEYFESQALQFLTDTVIFIQA